jgi:hypothetical protein
MKKKALERYIYVLQYFRLAVTALLMQVDILAEAQIARPSTRKPEALGYSVT